MNDSAPETPAPSGDSPSPGQAPTETSAPKSVPLASLMAERDKRQALEARLAAIESERAEADRAAAEEAGEYRKLYEDLKAKHGAAAEQLAALQSAETARLETLVQSNNDRIVALPEHLRGLIPDGLSPDATASQIARLEALHTKPTATPAMPPGGRVVGAGVDPEELSPEIAAWVDADAPHLRGVAAKTVRKHFNKFGPGRPA